MGCQVARERILRPEDEIVFPLAKGAFAQYEGGAGEARILRLFHRDREVAFGDPSLFAFGEALAGRRRFRAGDAMLWGRIEWPRARALLEQLIRAGLLGYADESEAGEEALTHEARPSPLRPAPCARAMTWDESEEVTLTLAGRAIETGHIELAVPIFRIASMYLDADDRQLGEANVFPPAMRLERPTLWRTCPYAGSRYQPERPMNVTALRAMRAHWRQMMVVVRRVGDACKARFPAIGERGWTVGDIERAMVCAMALPTYLMMRREGRVANGRLHPALSSTFRLTDGPRTTLHNMVFGGFGEAVRTDDTPMTGAGLHAYAERSHGFRSSRGVCAGPPAMIDDFLAVMLDGAEPRGGWPRSLDPEVADALRAIEPAIDYGLAGLRAHCAVYSLFPAAAAAKAELRRIAAGGPESPGLDGLRALLAEGDERDEGERSGRAAAYDAMDRQCGFGLDGRPPGPSLSERLEAAPPLAGEAAAALRAAFELYLGEGGEAPAAALAERLGGFIGSVRAALAAALEAQGRINALLGRDPPERPFTGRDLATGPYIGRDLSQYRAGTAPQTPPFLVDDLARLLGIGIEIGAGEVRVVRSPGGSA